MIILNIPLKYETFHLPEEIKTTNSSVLTAEKIEDFLNKEYKDARFHFSKDSFTNGLEKQLNATKQLHRDKGKKTFEETYTPDDVPCLIKLEGSAFNSISIRPIETKNIATKFASLITEKEIERFAKEYGLLGVLSSHHYGNVNYGPTVFEPIKIWKTHIQQIKRLLRLYEALKSKRSGKNRDIIGEIVSCDEHVYLDRYVVPFNWIDNSLRTTAEKLAYLITDKPINDELITDDAFIGMNILTFSIKNGLKNAIDIEASNIVPSESSMIGFRIRETYSTTYLLAAIYYDLWRLVNEDEDIHFCGNCGRPFQKIGRKKYCNDSCKSMAYQNRKKGDK
jgi:hypothetical protein